MSREFSSSRLSPSDPSHDIDQQQEQSPCIDEKLTVQGYVHTVKTNIGNATNVPTKQKAAVQKWQARLRQEGISIKAAFEGGRAETYNAHLLNRSYALPARDVEAEAAALSLDSSISPSPSNSSPLHITWYFSGENALRTFSVQVGENLRQEDFVRLRLPAQTLLLGEKKLKPHAHQLIYDQLNDYLKPVEKNTHGNRVILHGAPGLGKSYCAQHYLYYAASQRHQMVVWLSGTSTEAFERDWHRLAEQFRQIDSDLISMDDTTVIHTWCEKKLGQWLFVVDDVNVDAAALEQCLPRQGGHVLLTTRHPNYALSDAKKLEFSPLDLEDSHRLVEAYFGRYWSNTGHAAEEEHISQLLTVMAGYPVALAQAALLICKKGLSFARFMTQFQDTTTRIYLLQDTVFGELRSQQTVMECWADGRQQLLNTLKAALPKITSEEIEKNLANFIAALIQSAETADFSHHTTHVVKADDLVSISSEQQINLLAAYQTYLPAYLPIHFDVEKNTWRLTAMSFAVLQRVMGMALPIDLSVADEKAGEEEKEAGDSKTVGPLSMLSSKELIRPIAVNFSLSDGAQVGDIAITAQTENYEQRQAKLKSGWKLPRPNLSFIPREKLTQALADKLPVESKDEERTQQVLLTTAVTGMGGVGKTELARHFITQHPQSQNYRYRFWLDASTPSKLYSEYRELALYLRLIEQKPHVPDEEMLVRLKKWFSINQGWLLILDNADQYNSIEKLIPEVGGCVVVTTRDKRPGTLSEEHVIEVSVLAPEEAFGWLCQLAHRPVETLIESEKAAAQQLLEKLGYLPLAIAQAAAYLRANPDVSITAYLAQFAELLSDKTLAGREIVEEDNYARLVVSSTWNISRQAIRQQISHPELVDSLLGVCAYLAAKNIPLLILESWLQQAFLNSVESSTLVNYWLDEYVGQLLRYSLVDRDTQTQTLSLHNLLQEVMRLEDKNSLASEGIFAARLKPVANILKELYPHEKQLADYEKARVLLPHLEVVSVHLELLSTETAKDKNLVGSYQVDLLNAIGDFHRSVSRNTKQTWVHYQKALEINLKMYGDAHPSVAVSYNNVGIAYNHLGNTKKALICQQKALKIYLKAFGEMHYLVAIGCNNLGSIYHNLGNFQADLACQQKALEIRLKIYGDVHHPLIATSYVNLGETYRNLGDVQNALIYQQKALKMSLKIYGDVHPEVATSYNNLGEIYRSLGNVQDALSCHQISLIIHLEIYGENHLRVAGSYHNLGATHRCAGNAKEALSCHQKSLPIYLKTYGEEHSDVANSYSNLGEAHRLLGNIQDALTCQQKALRIRLKIYGNTPHPHVAVSYSNLGATHNSLGNYREALIWHQKASAIYQKVYTKAHPDIANNCKNLGSLHERLGDIATARTYLEKALLIYRQFNQQENIADVQRILATLQTTSSSANQSLENPVVITPTEQQTLMSLESLDEVQELAAAIALSLQPQFSGNNETLPMGHSLTQSSSGFFTKPNSKVASVSSKATTALHTYSGTLLNQEKQQASVSVAVEGKKAKKSSKSAQCCVAF